MFFKRQYFGLFIALMAILFATNASARQVCGTVRAVQSNKQDEQNIVRKPLARETQSCTSADYYDTVLTRKTEHFQIFYTLSGPHQTTPEFVDTLAKDVEYAYRFHTSKMGMLPPLGNEKSFHYQMDVTPGFYPVEVIDMDLLRATRIYLGGICHGCFGVTISEDYSEGKTTLVIDNDFRYTPIHRATKDTLMVNGKECVYDIADQELKNEAYGYSYADRWENGIRVTAIHELYHATQLRYMDLTNSWTFWFEASASGVEEIAAPDIDDYFAYLPTMSNIVGTPLEDMGEAYGAGIFFIYLNKRVSSGTDKFIWEGFAKSPEKSFWQILDETMHKKNFSTDSLFHDFSTRLSFAGNSSFHLDTALWITGDQSRWPAFKQEIHSSDVEEFTPQLWQHSYQFHNGGKPNLNEYQGSATAVAYMSQGSKSYRILSSNAADSLYTVLNRNPSVDSIVWVFSKINENTIPTKIENVPLRAYPTPWRSGNLCFGPLPQNKKFIEIRTRRGDLIAREYYNTQTHCLDESSVKKLMVPGVYRYRAGSSGKTKDFIVIY